MNKKSIQSFDHSIIRLHLNEIKSLFVFSKSTLNLASIFQPIGNPLKNENATSFNLKCLYQSWEMKDNTTSIPSLWMVYVCITSAVSRIVVRVIIVSKKSIKMKNERSRKSLIHWCLWRSIQGYPHKWIRIRASFVGHGCYLLEK